MDQMTVPCNRFDAANGMERSTSFGFTDNSWIAQSQGGHLEVSEGAAKNINLVRGLEVLSINQFGARTWHELVGEAVVGDPDGRVAAAAARLGNDIKAVVPTLRDAVSIPPPRVVYTRPSSCPNATTVTEEAVCDNPQLLKLLQY